MPPVLNPPTIRTTCRPSILHPHHPPQNSVDSARLAMSRPWGARTAAAAAAVAQWFQAGEACLGFRGCGGWGAVVVAGGTHAWRLRWRGRCGGANVCCSGPSRLPVHCSPSWYVIDARIRTPVFIAPHVFCCVRSVAQTHPSFFSFFRSEHNFVVKGITIPQPPLRRPNRVRFHPIVWRLPLDCNTHSELYQADVHLFLNSLKMNKEATSSL